MSNSPTPGTPQTGAKAVMAGIGAFVASFIVALTAATTGREDLDDLGTTAWLVIILGALATTIVAGGFAYTTKNRAL